jgi:heptosyltransferase-2
VGDAVLATPALRAIRAGTGGARITVLARPAIAEVLSGLPFFDDLLAYPKASDGKQAGVLATAKMLRARRFEAAVLFPNSLRSAITAWLARIPTRVGYARDGRSILLTRRIAAPRAGRKFLVESMLVYYARLAEAVGCPVADQRLELATTPEDVAAVDLLLKEGGAKKGTAPLIVLNPGGAFGPSKYWPAERFGQLADRLIARFGGRVVISGAPAEKPIIDRVAAAMTRPAVRLTDSPMRLSAVRELVRRADLLVTNDTGPRHFAIAFGTPVVTLFGSTDPAWTETHCPHERSVRIELPCSPCQQKTCPLGHHECMEKMTVEMVEAAAGELLELEMINSK